MTIAAYKSHKIIIVFNTKCGQSTLYSVFGQPWLQMPTDYFTDPVTKGETGLEWFINEFPDYYVAAFVRNPYARMVSMYNYSIQHTKVDLPPFGQYLKEAYIQRINGHSQLVPQTFYIGNYFDNIDFIGRQESLSNDVKFIAEKYDITFQMPPYLNTSKKISSWQEYYTPESKEIVYNNYKADFEMFYPAYNHKGPRPYSSAASLIWSI